MDGSIERIIIKTSEKRRNPDNDSTVKGKMQSNNSASSNNSITFSLPIVHLVGRYDQKVFDDREVKFTLGEGSDIGIVEGVEIAIERMTLGEVSKYGHVFDIRNAFRSIK